MNCASCAIMRSDCESCESIANHSEQSASQWLSRTRIFTLIISNSTIKLKINQILRSFVVRKFFLHSWKSKKFLESIFPRRDLFGRTLFWIQCILRFVDFSWPKNLSTNRVLFTNRVKVHKSGIWRTSYILQGGLLWSTANFWALYPIFQKTYRWIWPDNKLVALNLFWNFVLK